MESGARRVAMDLHPRGHLDRGGRLRRILHAL